MPTLINAVDVRPRVYYRTIQIGPILFEQAPAEDDICYGETALQSGHYHLRLLCRGRHHVEAALALDPFPPEGPHEDPLEVWVVQLWPIAD
ncbi:hypothetical protein [Streptomyces luteogriseus]|uniref:hypothetical protein n=1 Tax=Streptomyces luteogriseus TaxID=68233 RepID=UPI002E31237F|nr:hypothetical protein [Streptomyces luteogriseus]WTJ31943.1 hypothetical protein OID52_35215 [Streptomyces luteogriseus]